MADGCALDASVEIINSDTKLFNQSNFNVGKVCLELNNFSYNGKLKWINDYDSLKKFIKDSLKLRGKWSTPR